MIKFVMTQTVPAKGEVVTGKVIKDGIRKGFDITDRDQTVCVNHVIQSKHVPTGFYVIGVPVKTKKK